MKKIVSFILSIMLVFFVFAACDGGEPQIDDTPPIENEGTSILNDKKFKNGFNVRGLGEPIYPQHADEEKNGADDKFGNVTAFQYGKSGLDSPLWTLSQWSTRYSFANEDYTDFSQVDTGVYSYKNKSKSLKVDTNTGEFDLGLKASECYVYGDRGSGQEWPHLLIERNITNQVSPSPFTKISDKEKIVASVTTRLNSFDDKMTVTANPGVHAAQLVYYLFISNRNPDTKTFDDMIWLGIMIFDNRHEFVPQADFIDSGSKGSATEKYIYNLPTDAFLSKDNNFWQYGKIADGKDSKWVTTSVDVLPYIKTALERAQAADCMVSSSYENLYVSGMYIGYELPGTYDIDMSFKNLDIRVQ